MVPIRIIGVIAGFTLLLVHMQVAAQVELSSSDLPLIHINTNGQEIQDEPRITAQMSVWHKADKQRNHLDDPPDHYEGRISIEIRGSTSQDFPKKSFSLETQDALGDNLNIALLDMPAENDWVLYGPYSDKTLIRNVLAYQISRELGHYAPRTRFCELLINNNYMGVYVLTEKIKRDVNRVNIDRLDPGELTGEDLSGGYILKVDKVSGNSGQYWQTDIGGINFQYEYPDYDEITSGQKNYIKSFLNSFENSLTDPDFADPINGYRNFLDERSAIDLFIVNEVSKNIDGYMMSSFFYKEKDSKGGKIHMGPVWDYNLAFSNADYREGFRTSGLQVKINTSMWWWDQLLGDTSFTAAIVDRWSSVRKDIISDNRVMQIIDSLSLGLNEAQQRNFTQWDILGRNIWPNYYVGESYAEEISYLKQWTIGRMKWLDNKFHYWTGLEDPHTGNSSLAYPNPFMDKICFKLELERPCEVSLELFDIQGRKLKTLIDCQLSLEGEHYFEWPADDLQAGVYLLALRLDSKIFSWQKIIKQ